MTSLKIYIIFGRTLIDIISMETSFLQLKYLLLPNANEIKYNFFKYLW